MAQLLNKAQPGDVITAEDWNLLIDAVNELLQASQTTGIKISGSFPAGSAIDPIRIGTILQVQGQNFGFAIGLSKVTFEAGATKVTVVRAQMLNGSWDERLLFMMPPVPGITPEGMTMTMRVSNGVAEDSRSVFVMPIVIDLAGDIFVTFRGDTSPNPNPKPNPLESGAGKSAEFRYRLQTGINMPASFSLNAEILNSTVPVPPAMVNLIEFRDDSNNVISGKQVEMGKNEARNVTVRIPEIPPAFANQSFSLRVSATGGGLVGTDQRTFTVGAPVTPPDPNIEADQTGFSVVDRTSGLSEPESGSFDGTTIKVKIGKRGVVAFSVKLTKTGVYDFTILPKPGGTLTNWSPEMTPDTAGVRSPDGTKVTVNVVNDNDQSTRLVKFRVSPTQGATPNGTVVFRIKRQGSNSDFFKEYGVELMS